MSCLRVCVCVPVTNKVDLLADNEYLPSLAGHCLSCASAPKACRRQPLFAEINATGDNLWTINAALNAGSLAQALSAKAGQPLSATDVTTTILHYAASRRVEPAHAYLCNSCAAPYKHQPQVISFADTLARHATGNAPLPPMQLRSAF